jgi:hypothetical protein
MNVREFCSAAFGKEVAFNTHGHFLVTQAAGYQTQRNNFPLITIYWVAGYVTGLLRYYLKTLSVAKITQSRW